jgi:hypothetical protein
VRREDGVDQSRLAQTRLACNARHVSAGPRIRGGVEEQLESGTRCTTDQRR